MIRALDGGDVGGGGSGERLRPVDKIEAKYRGGSRWFSGEVVRERADGSYDVRYDDGDSESGVRAEDIRSKGGGDDRNGASSSSSSFRVGDLVEADFKGRGKWFKGEITSVEGPDRFGDSTFSIRYEDGDRESGVIERMIRKRGGSNDDRPRSPSRSGGGERLRPGDKIEAKYRGGSRWFSGEVVRERADGSYDVRYDDGDSESGVRAEDIRSKGGGDDRNGASSSSSSFRVGDLVEADFKGRGKWFKGE